MTFINRISLLLPPSWLGNISAQKPQPEVFSHIDRLNRILFILVIAVLGVEFVKLPLGLSLYKVVIVPACSLGTLLLMIRGVRLTHLATLVPLLLFVFMMFFSYLKWGVQSSFVSGAGLVPFFLFVFLYLVEFGWPKKATLALAFWSTPHLVSLILFQMGLSREAFSDSAFRFDGIHVDPNFMVLFILASITGKILSFGFLNTRIMKVCLWGLILLDIFMVGMSGSRGGAMGLVATVFVYFAVQKGLGRAVVIFLVTAVVLNVSFSLVYYNLPEKIALSPFWVTVDRVINSGTMGNLNSSSGDRIYLWENAKEMVIEKGPLVGYTIENFRKKYWLYPHNTFVDAALECGVPGLLLLMLLLSFSALVLWWRLGSLEKGGVQALLLGVAFWGTLLFLSSFNTKVFWLSVILPYAMSIRIVLAKSNEAGSWGVCDGS